MALEQKIKDHITENGPVTVAEYMRFIAIEEHESYYQKQQPFGATGDFITAPEASQIFGELLGIWCAIMWQILGSPKEWLLVETGPGRGLLMQDLLRGTKHIEGFQSGCHIHLVEKSTALRAIQKEAINHSHLSWHESISELPSDVPMIIIGNEFLDAFPIHQFEKRGAIWHERYVTQDDNGQLTFTLKAATSLPITPKETDQFIEYCPEACHIVAELNQRFTQQLGAALFIDYGYDQNPNQESLQALKNHQFHPVLETPGEADITALVDFERLKAHVKNSLPLQSQGALLRELGIEQRLEQLLQHADEDAKKTLLRGVERLIAPEQMGRLFKAFAFGSEAINFIPGFGEKS